MTTFDEATRKWAARELPCDEKMIESVRFEAVNGPEYGPETGQGGAEVDVTIRLSGGRTVIVGLPGHQLHEIVNALVDLAAQG